MRINACGVPRSSMSAVAFILLSTAIVIFDWVEGRGIHADLHGGTSTFYSCFSYLFSYHCMFIA